MWRCGWPVGMSVALPQSLAEREIWSSIHNRRCSRSFRGLGVQQGRYVLDLALKMAEDLLHPRPFHPAAPHLEVLTDLRQPASAELRAARLEGVGDEDEVVVVPGGQSQPQLREPARSLGQEAVDDGRHQFLAGDGLELPQLIDVLGIERLLRHWYRRRH